MYVYVFFHCQINKNDRSERITPVRLEGSLESRQQAKSLIEDLVQNNFSAGRGSSSDNWRTRNNERGSENSSSGYRQRADTKQIFIPNNKVGRVIGEYKPYSSYKNQI